MLGLGSLTTVTSCFVFCFCSDKVRKKRQTPARHGNDQAGEYQRVESVSSIVDHVREHAEMYEDEEQFMQHWDQERSDIYDDREHSENRENQVDDVIVT